MGRRIQSVASVVREIDRAIARLQLDLSGLTVLTEAATGWFATTAVIAARAGADKVLAVGRDSEYGSSAEVESAVYELARHAECSKNIEIHFDGPLRLAPRADIVTNLGFVRPITSEF